jgi:hypothetical protein
LTALAGSPLGGYKQVIVQSYRSAHDAHIVASRASILPWGLQSNGSSFEQVESGGPKTTILATVTAEGFWGDFALVMGALLVLLSLMETGVTEVWTKWMTVIGASLLATGTMLTAGSDLNAYAEEHIAQGEP